MCLALHARREETEIPDVVPVAVGDVIGQCGQELSRRVGGLDRPFRAGVLRQESDFLTIDLAKPVLRDRWASGIVARISEELLLAAESLDVDVPPAFVLRGEQLCKALEDMSVSSTPPRAASRGNVMMALRHIGISARRSRSDRTDKDSLFGLCPYFTLLHYSRPTLSTLERLVQ